MPIRAFRKHKFSRQSITARTLSLLAGCIFSLSISAATITVNSLGDSGTNAANCELRSAITAANTDAVVDSCSSGSGADTIILSVNGVISLNSALPSISESVEIQGPGHTMLTVSGGGQYRIFYFLNGSGDHALKSFTLIKGAAATGGCALHQADNLVIENMVIQQCEADSVGGALVANANTRIYKSLFKENVSGSHGGAVYFAVAGSHKITDSSFVQNATINSDITHGGAIYINAGDLGITRSTFNLNSAATNGGAIYANASLSISHSTVVGNTADSNSSASGFGGGIYFTGSNHTLTIGNSIVSDNFNFNDINRPDLAIGPGYTLISNGYNLIGDNAIISTEFPAGSPNVNNDYVGMWSAPLTAGLDSLGYYGGPTPTMPPMAGSLPVDHGNCPAETADQRGFSNGVSGLRVIDNPPVNSADGCDIGAVELQLYLQEDVFKDGFESILP